MYPLAGRRGNSYNTTILSFFLLMRGFIYIYTRAGGFLRGIIHTQKETLPSTKGQARETIRVMVALLQGVSLGRLVFLAGDATERETGRGDQTKRRRDEAERRRDLRRKRTEEKMRRRDEAMRRDEETKGRDEEMRLGDEGERRDGETRDTEKR